MPPRPLSGSETNAVEWLIEKCETVEPFDVVMGDVESFVPTTPTVFLRVAHAAYKIRELHDQMNGGPLGCAEELPFMPHLTIAKMENDETARHVYEVARDRWDHYEGSHCAHIEKLSFVRGRETKWTDIAPICLRPNTVRK